MIINVVINTTDTTDNDDNDNDNDNDKNKIKIIKIIIIITVIISGVSASLTRHCFLVGYLFAVRMMPILPVKVTCPNQKCQLTSIRHKEHKFPALSLY